MYDSKTEVYKSIYLCVCCFVYLHNWNRPINLCYSNVKLLLGT